MKYRWLGECCDGCWAARALSESVAIVLAALMGRRTSSRAVALRLAVGLFATAAQGCSGYSDGSSAPEVSSMPASPPPSAARAGRNEQLPPTLEPASQTGSAGRAAADSGGMAESSPDVPMNPNPAPVEMDASPAATDDSYANLRMTRSSSFDGYLTDGFGQPLYMFVGDVSGAPESACLCDCARDWPAFDVAVAHTSAGLDSAQVSRFHRQDGAWQTTYKGHALYYRASETGTREVTGDAVDGRWFVARDYLAFLSSARTFAPEGGTATNDAFLTDGFGRTLYVCLDDQPRMAETEAISSCDAACTIKRPLFAAADPAQTVLLPSVIDSDELQPLARPDGQLQLTYRGWPLYYYRGDVGPGSTEGHNDRAWRAIDPISFGIDPEPDSGN
jgi:predicted lipoprotein with Yx(FWY)xxD motif